MWLCLPGASEYKLKMGRLNFIHRYRRSVNSEVTYILCNAHYYNFLQNLTLASGVDKEDNKLCYQLAKWPTITDPQ